MAAKSCAKSDWTLSGWCAPPPAALVCAGGRPRDSVCCGTRAGLAGGRKAVLGFLPHPRYAHTALRWTHLPQPKPKPVLWRSQHCVEALLIHLHLTPRRSLLWTTAEAVVPAETSKTHKISSLSLLHCGLTAAVRLRCNGWMLCVMLSSHRRTQAASLPAKSSRTMSGAAAFDAALPCPPLQHPATSAPGLGSRLPHLRRDWSHACHICTGTGRMCAEHRAARPCDRVRRSASASRPDVRPPYSRTPGH